MNDLELYTTQQLIEEITNRSTFAGVIFQSLKEVKSETKPILHDGWDITYCHLSEDIVCKLLENAVQHFKQLSEQE